MLIAYFLAHRLLVSTDMECNRTRYYLSKVEGVSPYPVCKYMIKVASPVILHLIMSVFKSCPFWRQFFPFNHVRINI